MSGRRHEGVLMQSEKADGLRKLYTERAKGKEVGKWGGAGMCVH